jgi:hypothetical protein
MSIFPFLQLQPLEEPSDDGTLSDLDVYEQDDTIDLTHDITEEELEQFESMLAEDNDVITFSKE